MKITVVGTGYVGLVSGTCLAEVGNDVLCLDVDPEKIRILEEGGIPIYEPGLEEMVHRNMKKDRLHFTTSIAEAFEDCEVRSVWYHLLELLNIKNKVYYCKKFPQKLREMGIIVVRKNKGMCAELKRIL